MLDTKFFLSYTVQYVAYNFFLIIYNATCCMQLFSYHLQCNMVHATFFLSYTVQFMLHATFFQSYTVHYVAYNFFHIIYCTCRDFLRGRVECLKINCRPGTTRMERWDGECQYSKEECDSTMMQESDGTLKWRAKKSLSGCVGL